jgi:hypothetical protein
VITIKESIPKAYKLGKVNTNWLERALLRKDSIGRCGMDIFKKHNIQIVRKGKADFGLSLNGDKVKNISKNKTILIKGEPPIYNIYFGRKLCNQKFLDQYLGVLSYAMSDGLKQEHYNSPQDAFEFVDKYFDIHKPNFLCMILKNKKTTISLNKLFPSLSKYSKYSNMNLRMKVDKQFCMYFGPDMYHSYGRGWQENCFKGFVPGGSHATYEVISKYQFNFCPENSRFNGYVTEKPLQAMCCGSIPIYIGAPDVYNYLPKGTFINFEEYCFKDLCEYLKYMDMSEYNAYKKRMKTFVTSNESEMFSSYIFAKKLVLFMEEKI